ncbi:hypothetical protein M8J75_003184 [Diaphorina citri]|nr:hypothetical protein M8J75_006964 [Diaphorina citri]KAI5709814.1 hypothetical protein M8J75_003481 [Diaphorina citri]KAI5711790.1 hypothetical protein M8J75_003184 [Diaphorina citri]
MSTMTDTTVEVPTTCNTIDSNQARSNAQSVDIHKYVTQLEKRVLEQEQLIALLNDKISGLESRSGKKSYYQALVNQDNPTTSSGSSGSHATVQSADGVVASGSSSADGNGQRIKNPSLLVLLVAIRLLLDLVLLEMERMSHVLKQLELHRNEKSNPRVPLQ